MDLHYWSIASLWHLINISEHKQEGRRRQEEVSWPDLCGGPSDAHNAPSCVCVCVCGKTVGRWCHRWQDPEPRWACEGVTWLGTKRSVGPLCAFESGCDGGQRSILQRHNRALPIIHLCSVNQLVSETFPWLSFFPLSTLPAVRQSRKVDSLQDSSRLAASKFKTTSVAAKEKEWMYLFIMLQLSRPWQGVFRGHGESWEGDQWVQSFPEDRKRSKDIIAVGDDAVV